ncbi:MAG TPA: flagellar biosynthetic protein FliR [Synergistaceae bacterium]|nr:flagellar biosynthetic protein FliR [Synergistaceae bacterium]
MTDPSALSSLLVVYVLLSLRFAGLFFSSPPFTASSLPLPLRFWLAFLLGVLALPGKTELVSLELLEVPLGVLLLGTREFLVGLGLGFLSALPLYVLQIGGRVIGMQMGFGMVNVMDPMSQTQVPIIGQFSFIVGMWFFFFWDGHLLLIQAVVESLKLIPLGSPFLLFRANPELGEWLQHLFILSMRMVLPFFGTLLLADVGLGFVARTVPQMNVFVLGLPLKVGLGFFLLMVILPLAVDLLHSEISKALLFALERMALWQ